MMNLDNYLFNYVVKKPAPVKTKNQPIKPNMKCYLRETGPKPKTNENSIVFFFH